MYPCACLACGVGDLAPLISIPAALAEGPPGVLVAAAEAAAAGLIGTGATMEGPPGVPVSKLPLRGEGKLVTLAAEEAVGREISLGDLGCTIGTGTGAALAATISSRCCTRSVDIGMTLKPLLLPANDRVDCCRLAAAATAVGVALLLSAADCFESLLL